MQSGVNDRYGEFSPNKSSHRAEINPKSWNEFL